MIKKFISIISAIVLSVFSLLCISSCDAFKSDEEIIDDKVMDIIQKLEKSDKEGLKKLFAKSIIKNIDNFDETIDELFDYYDGEYVSKVRGGHGDELERDGNGFVKKWWTPSYDIKTTEDRYRIAFYWCKEYSTDKNFIGIWSFYIVKYKDDDNPEYSYRGDGLWFPGINISKT